MRRGEKRKVLLPVVLAAVLLAGCGTGEEPRVIGEQQETTAEGQGNGGTDFPGHPGEGTGSSVREQVQAPDRYVAEVKGEHVTLSADAPVNIPNVEQAPVRTARLVNFTEEEYQKVKAVLAEQLELEWREVPLSELENEGDVGDGKAVLTSAEGISASGELYELSYRRFQGENASILSLIWLSKVDFDTVGRSLNGPAHVYGQGEEIEGLPSGRGAELEKKAEQLVADAGYGQEYQRYQGRWRESFYTLREKQWSEAEYYTTFTPVAGGIGCTRNVVNLLENYYMDGPYIEVYYDGDGGLNQMKIIGRSEILPSEKTEEFLLPFEAVHQLFEQYCNDYFNSRENLQADSAVSGEGEVKGFTSANAHVYVKNVKLEYAFMESGDQRDEGGQELVPVWNFYGSIMQAERLSDQGDTPPEKYWTARQEPDGLILSIRADDGQVLADAP